MNFATQCDLCKEPIEGKAFADSACEHPVCGPCRTDLDIARLALNKAGMEDLFLGPCPDNGPEGLANP